MIACCAIAMATAVTWCVRSTLSGSGYVRCKCTVVDIQCSRIASALKKRGDVKLHGERYGGAASSAPVQQAACCTGSLQEFVLEFRGVEGAEPPLPPLPLPPLPPRKLFDGLYEFSDCLLKEDCDPPLPRPLWCC